MTNNDAAMVIEYKAIIVTIMSIRLKLRGVFTDIFNKNPKSIPEKVVNNALSFSIVSYVERVCHLYLTSCHLQTS